MAKSSAVFEAAAFKPVPEGFVFRAANWWVFGRGRHFLVNEAQKAEIVERVTRRGRVSLLVAMLVWLGVIAAGVSALAALTGHDDPTFLDTLVMLALAAVSLVVCLQVRYRLLLRPLIAALPESRERFTLSERREAIRKVAATGSNWLLPAALFGVACVAFLYAFFQRTHGGHLTLQDGPALASLFAAVAAAVASARFFWLEIAGGKSVADDGGDVASQPAKDPFVRRLERLEDENRWLRKTLAGALAVGAVVAVGATVASGLSGSVTSDRFVLRNSRGAVAVLLGVGKGDTATLGLNDPDGKSRMIIGLASTGSPLVGLYDANQHSRVTFALTNSGSPAVGLYGPRDERRMTMSLADDGSPSLQMNGADGKPRLVLTVSQDTPGIVLSDSHGAVRLRLAVDDTGVPIRIFDAASVPIKAFDAAGKEVPAQK